MGKWYNYIISKLKEIIILKLHLNLEYTSNMLTIELTESF